MGSHHGGKAVDAVAAGRDDGHLTALLTAPAQERLRHPGSHCREPPCRGCDRPARWRRRQRRPARSRPPARSPGARWSPCSANARGRHPVARAGGFKRPESRPRHQNAITRPGAKGFRGAALDHQAGLVLPRRRTPSQAATKGRRTPARPDSTETGSQDSRMNNLLLPGATAAEEHARRSSSFQINDLGGPASSATVIQSVQGNLIRMTFPIRWLGPPPSTALSAALATAGFRPRRRRRAHRRRHHPRR